MANTYYDSDLTGEQIEQALEAIDGVIVPANNGKVLAINNGKIEARSVQWDADLGPKSITENGTYNPASDNLDGYSQVTVNVSGGGGTTDANHVTYNSSETYDSGTVGAALNEQRNTLNSEIATRQTYVRPNLLDNWYFGNPVNQRGQTSYSNAGYTIDRWRIVSDTIVNIATGLVITNQHSTNRRQLGQYYESPSNLYGKTVTGSVLLSNGELYYGTITFPASPPSGEYIIPFVNFSGNTLRVVIETSGKIEFMLVVAAESSVSVLAMKLELGSGQTLCHNKGTDENPVWVLNEIPDYGEQLRRCQRYLYRYNCPTPHFSSTETYMMLPIVHDFASTPSSIVESADISWYRIDGVQTNITNKTLEIADATVNSLNIKLTPTPAPGSSNKNKLGYITRLNVLVSAEQ